MSLVDEHSCLMDRLCLEAFLIDSSLESLVQKLVRSKTQNVIELKFLIGEKTISMHSVEKGGSLEQSSWVFLFKSKKLSGGLSESGKEEMDSPDLSLVLETIFADQLQFVIDSLLFEGSSGCVKRRRI